MEKLKIQERDGKKWRNCGPTHTRELEERQINSETGREREGWL